VTGPAEGDESGKILSTKGMSAFETMRKNKQEPSPETSQEPCVLGPGALFPLPDPRLSRPTRGDDGTPRR
jgi:hypothetical protein